jgi:transcriptional regulator with XRE-family HTH domain
VAAGAGGAGAWADVMAPILGVQCFLARTALGWSLPQLARAAGVSYHTVQCFERGDSVRPSTVKAIQLALAKAGVIFIDANDGGPGARLGG